MRKAGAVAVSGLSKSNMQKTLAVIELQGGLGNQLFQLAAAMHLQKTHEVLFNPAYYLAVRNRRLALADFYSPIEFIKPLPDTFVYLLGLPGFQSTWQKIYEKLPHYLEIISEKQPYHFQQLQELPATDIYLRGYWQHYRYVDQVEKALRSVLQFKPEIEQAAQPWLTEISETNSVAIHVRRGDYTYAQGFSVTPVAYYQKALSFIHKKVKKPHYVVFSDDIEWCKKNLTFIPTPTFIEPHQNEVIDFLLLSRCKHDIIANSTFSWWGAWLNQNPQKIVLFPKPWNPQQPKTDSAFGFKTWHALSV